MIKAALAGGYFHAMVHPCEHAAALGAPSDVDEALALRVHAMNDKLGHLHRDWLAWFLEHVRPDRKGN
jgi:hypothetical protein